VELRSRGFQFQNKSRNQETTAGERVLLLKIRTRQGKEPREAPTKGKETQVRKEKWNEMKRKKLQE